MAGVQIRRLTEIEDLERVQELERRVWGVDEMTPTHQTLTVVKNGGFILGAFQGEQLIGFQYSFPGFDGSVYLCSHMLGIDPDYRNAGLGERLKREQRNTALELGYTQIRWTYDPLEMVNGYLNLTKLGAVASTYIENCYGSMRGSLNQGLPSDRFLVQWNITGGWERPQPVTETDLAKIRAASVIRWKQSEAGYPLVKEVDLARSEGSDSVYAAIPAHFQRIKEQSMADAIEWRMRTRDVFTHFFQTGWEVVHVHKNTDPTEPVHFYELRRQKTE